MGVQQARSPLCYDDGGPQPNLEERKPFMKHPALSAALAMILGIVAGCASTRQPGQMDCRALTAGSIGPSIGLRAGPPLLGVGPEFTFGGEYWDPEVQTLVAGYREACLRRNAGQLSDVEYRQRLDELDRRGCLFGGRQRGIFNDMDRVTREQKEATRPPSGGDKYSHFSEQAQ